jgi:signal transduction histidine kinase
VRADSPTAEVLEVRQALGMRSYICAPMTARGRTVGAITFLHTTESDRRYDEADLAVAQELARRAATAIDNAMLYREVVEANQAKSDFLAVMSHELRTPLTAVIGYSELIADEIVGPVNATQKEQLSRIRSSSTHLLNLIEEILAFARIEAGQETVRLEGVELRAVVREAQEVIEPLISRKRLRLVADLPAERVEMDTDPGKLRQILLNLIANAVKFTDEGEIRVTLRRDGSAVELSVADSGVGIPPAHLERIFDPFWQVEQTRTRKVGGTGLGLSVARQLARLLGGDLTVESEVGRGSTFRVRLGTEPTTAGHPRNE